MASLFGWSKNVEMESNTILANQPYSERTENGVANVIPCRTK